MGWRLRDLESTNVYELKTGDVFGRTEGKFKFPEAHKMSRSHCQFIIENDMAFLVDLNSTNGVKVGIEKVDARSKTMIGNGVEIFFGGKKFKMEQVEELAPVWSPKKVVPLTTSQATPETVMNVPKDYKFSFNVKKSEFFIIMVKNFFFIILTLGIYLPYARTNLRKYMWKSTSLNKTPFVFKAEGAKLLGSYLILGGIFIVANIVIAALEAMFGKTLPVLIGISLLKSLVIFLLIIRARYSSYCYLVNNTSYRSIHMRVSREGGKSHFWTSIIGLALTFITLGLYYPIMSLKLEKIKWSNTSFGKTNFSFHGDNKTYWLLCVKGFFLTFLTLGLYGTWFLAALHRYRMGSVKFNGVPFVSKVDGGELFALMLKSLFFIVITFGLASPFMYNKYLGYMIDHLSIKGIIDFDSILQGARNQGQGSLSEAVNEVFDSDAGLDIL